MGYMSRLVVSDRGATMVEYAVIVAMVTVVTVAVLSFVGMDVFRTFRFMERSIDVR